MVISKVYGVRVNDFVTQPEEICQVLGRLYSRTLIKSISLIGYINIDDRFYKDIITPFGPSYFGDHSINV